MTARRLRQCYLGPMSTLAETARARRPVVSPVARFVYLRPGLTLISALSGFGALLTIPFH